MKKLLITAIFLTLATALQAEDATWWDSVTALFNKGKQMYEDNKPYLDQAKDYAVKAGLIQPTAPAETPAKPAQVS